MRWNGELGRLCRRTVCLAAITVFAAGCATHAVQQRHTSIVGLWAAQQVAGTAVPADAHVTLSLYGNGRAVGRGGCNNFATSYKRDDAAISFAPVISTKMACAPEAMSLEQSYLDTLAAVTRVERRADGTLALSTDAGAQLLFRRQEPASLQDARARGIDFRAVGQEPAWVVEVKEGDHISAVLDYGATPLQLPTPDAKSAADGTVTYDASTDTDHLVLSIKQKACIDAMSGESHASTVELTVNDKAYHGCGDWLD